jgi:hypothetical protein
MDFAPSFLPQPLQIFATPVAAFAASELSPELPDVILQLLPDLSDLFGRHHAGASGCFRPSAQSFT